MPTGEITVTGKGLVRIPLAGRPKHVFCQFEHEPNWVPCNPHHHDSLKWLVDPVDEDKRQHHKIPHTHHDRQWVLVIEWEVSNVEVIRWNVTY